MQETITTAPLINVSERASAEIARLTGGGGQFIRIWVTEGGCAGMTYEASVDTTETPFDRRLFTAGPVRIVADRNSARHVDGLEIDYSDDLINLGFRFRNPNAGKACGCGASFAV